MAARGGSAKVVAFVSKAWNKVLNNEFFLVLLELCGEIATADF